MIARARGALACIDCRGRADVFSAIRLTTRFPTNFIGALSSLNYELGLAFASLLLLTDL